MQVHQPDDVPFAHCGRAQIFCKIKSWTASRSWRACGLGTGSCVFGASIALPVGSKPPFHSGCCAETEDAMDAIDRKRIKGSSRDGWKPRRRQKPAASKSTAWVINARPPISCAALTVRKRACLMRPVPMPRPAHSRSVASCPSNRHGTGSGGWPVRMDRGRESGTTADGARP